MFDELATWLAAQPERQAIVGTTCWYDGDDGTFTFVLFMGEPLENGEDDVK